MTKLKKYAKEHCDYFKKYNRYKKLDSEEIFKTTVYTANSIFGTNDTAFVGNKITTGFFVHIFL